MNLTAIMPFNVNSASRNNAVKANNVSFGMAQLPDKDLTQYRDEFVKEKLGETIPPSQEEYKVLESTEDPVLQKRLVFCKGGLLDRSFGDPHAMKILGLHAINSQEDIEKHT